MLYATGLVAGGSLAGIAIAMLVGFGDKVKTGLNEMLNVGGNYYERMGLGGDAIAVGMFALLAMTIVRQGLSKDEAGQT
jgi:hypothetical protein